MQTPYNQQDDEDYFANALYNKNIESIIPTTELLINFKDNGIKTKRTCFVYAEKMNFKGLIQIRLTEKGDQRKMYVTTIDSGSFPELKQDQSLHVTFSGFVDNLVQLLHDCQAGKLEIFVVHLISYREERFSPSLTTSNGVSSQSEYQLQFLEIRSFKNLVHLSLPCRIAPIGVVLFYISNILEKMQTKMATHDQITQQYEHEMNMLHHRYEQLEAENRKLRESQQENTFNMNQQHTEELHKLQETIRKNNDQRRNDNERNWKTISKLQGQIEKLNIEKTNIQTEKAQEIKRLESLNEELKNSVSQSTELKFQNEKLQTEIASLKNEERKTEMHLKDARNQISDLNDKLRKFEKQKADILAELDAEKNISQTKRQALEVATEEISKANEIIYKQSQDLLTLEKTIDWRTEIALQQEKAINEKDHELSVYDEEMKQMRFVVDNLRQEVPEQLESLRKFANNLEKKYKEEIQALQDSIKACEEDKSSDKYKNSTSSNDKWHI